MTTKLPPSYLDPKIFKNQYLVKQQLSSGSFGVVYLAIDKITRQEYAIKLEKDDCDEVPTLEREVQVLNRLKNVEGVPQLIWNGFEQNYHVIVLELGGKDLAYYMKSHRKFSLKTSLQLAKSLTATLERIHKCDVVHRDLKPENIITGRDDPSNIFLIDYGVSKLLLNSKNEHIPFSDKKSFIGTARYSSIAAHKGFELGRKDDLESLFYGYSKFLNGIHRKLPWQNLPNIQDKDRTVAVGDVKIQTETQNLCEDLPVEFLTILNYIKKLEFKSEPNYEFIQENLSQAAQNCGITLDRIYDWTSGKFKQEQSPLREVHQISDKKLGLLKPPNSNFLQQQHQPNLVHLEVKARNKNSYNFTNNSIQIIYSPSNKNQKIVSPIPNSNTNSNLVTIGCDFVQNTKSELREQKIVSQPQFQTQQESIWTGKAMDEYEQDSQKLIDKFKHLQQNRVLVQQRYNMNLKSVSATITAKIQ